MKDGTTIVGEIKDNLLKFKTGYGEVDIVGTNIVQFKDGVLTLKDQSNLKGSFTVDVLSISTAQGALKLPISEIVSITRPQTPEVATPPAPVIPSNVQPIVKQDEAAIVGKVFDNFGQPLPGVTVSIAGSKFTGNTDEQGAYSVGYVPGKVNVQYGKEGYFSKDTVIEIAAPAKYPAQDVVLFKVPTGNSVFFVGKQDYLPLSQVNPQTQAMEFKGGSMFDPSRESARDVWSVAGAPLVIPQQQEFFFVDTAQGYRVLMRANPRREFLTVRKYGLAMASNCKYEYELIPQELYEIAPGVKLIKMTIPPGDYVFISTTHPNFKTALDTSMVGFATIGKPVFYIRVGGRSTVAATTTSKRTSASPARVDDSTPFGQATKDVRDIQLFEKHTQVYAFPYDKVWDAVYQSFTELKLKALTEDKEKGILISDLGRPGLLGISQVQERYCLLMEKVDDSSTRVTFELMKYYVDQSGKTRPDNGNFIAGKAKSFLKKIDTKLKKPK